jgi:hypothetical protein
MSFVDGRNVVVEHHQKRRFPSLFAMHLSPRWANLVPDDPQGCQLADREAARQGGWHRSRREEPRPAEHRTGFHLQESAAYSEASADPAQDTLTIA